jgi:Radical SAM superfamily
MSSLQEALAKMVAPGDRRNSIWRGGVLQVWVTRACNQACTHCTQGSNLGGKSGFITPEQYSTALASLQGYFGVVGMFGGLPTLHPQFEELCIILRYYVPYEQRGLWANDPKGKGATCRTTFNPAVSNLNCHLDMKAYKEFKRDWPESTKYLKGQDTDSRHGPVYVAMQDVIPEESERYDLIGNCDINKYWSAIICVVNGELRGFFCEIAGAMAMLHQNDPTWPDLGVPIVPGWWKQSMQAFKDQVEHYCNRCGVPLKGKGDYAINGTTEQVSETHKDIYKLKDKTKLVQLVTSREQVAEGYLPKSTDYLENGRNL